MRILITNNGLVFRGGTEMYVRDVATELRERGHDPVVYSSQIGSVAHELRAGGVTVVEDLRHLTNTPDVIHGHHHIDAMTALLHFPGVPAVHFCHGPAIWLEAPVIFPRILRYLAVDEVCRDRLLNCGIARDRIRVLLNSVDLNRFKARAGSLPSKPRRALVFSNYATEATHLPPIREVCTSLNIEVDVLGLGSNNAVPNPEAILPGYDIVFAKGRCALESLAVGAAVVLCDATGVGPMVTSAEFERLRPLNFGFRTLRSPLDTAVIRDQIARYDPADATMVSSMVRATASHETVVDELIRLYQEVTEEYRVTDDDFAQESRAAALYLRQLRIELTIHGTAPIRLREKLQSVPILGRWAPAFVRWLTTTDDVTDEVAKQPIQNES